MSVNMSLDSYWKTIELPTYNTLESPEQFIYGGYGKIVRLCTLPIETQTTYPVLDSNNHIKTILQLPQKELPKTTLQWTQLAIYRNGTKTFAYDLQSNERPLEQLPKTNNHINLDTLELMWRRSYRRGDIADTCVDSTIATFYNTLFGSDMYGSWLKQKNVTKASNLASGIARLTRMLKPPMTNYIGTINMNTPNIAKIRDIIDNHTIIACKIETGAIIDLKNEPIREIKGNHAICLAKCENEILFADIATVGVVNNLSLLFKTTMPLTHPIKPWSDGFYICAGNKLGEKND